jgi:DNA-binding transcriptional ArsR family regulator
MPTKTRPTRRRAPLPPPDERIIRAMSHPVRFQALSILNERVASPNEMARELGESVGVLAYHVRVLRDMGAIELVETKPRRGATEHFYRATVRAWFSDEDYSRLPARTRRVLFAPTVRRIVDDAVGALTEGGFDESDAHASWTPLDLDEAGHAEAATLISETVEQLLAIQARAATRANKSGTDQRARSEVALMHFRPGRRSAGRSGGKRAARA